MRKCPNLDSDHIVRVHCYLDPKSSPVNVSSRTSRTGFTSWNGRLTLLVPDARVLMRNLAQAYGRTSLGSSIRDRLISVRQSYAKDLLIPSPQVLNYWQHGAINVLVETPMSCPLCYCIISAHSRLQLRNALVGSLISLFKSN